VTARHHPCYLPGGKYEVVFRHHDEPGIEVVLLIPDDTDLLEPLNRQTLTVAGAIKAVARRRLLDREMAEIDLQERNANAWREHPE
jgi:hypothetical protein